MTKNEEYECFGSKEDDPVLRIMGKYQNKPSMKSIKFRNKNKSQPFRHRGNNTDEMIKSIQNLDLKNESQKRNMNKTILTKNAALNASIQSSNLHNKLKSTDTVSLHISLYLKEVKSI